MKKLLKKTLLFISLISLFSCNDNYIEKTSIQQDYSKVKFSSINSNERLFIEKLKSLDINLNEDEIQKVRNLSKVKAKYEWTPGPENDSKLNLEKHFIKHGKDFNPPFNNSQEYLEAAVKAANDKSKYSNYYFDVKYYKDSKIISLIKWNSKTYNLTVTRENGQIATYFLDRNINNNRFVLYPKD